MIKRSLLFTALLAGSLMAAHAAAPAQAGKVMQAAPAAQPTSRVEARDSLETLSLIHI